MLGRTGYVFGEKAILWDTKPNYNHRRVTEITYGLRASVEDALAGENGIHPRDSFEPRRSQFAIVIEIGETQCRSIFWNGKAIHTKYIYGQSTIAGEDRTQWPP